MVETDPQGELSSIQLTNHPLSPLKSSFYDAYPEASWKKTFSQEFNVSISTLSSFISDNVCLACVNLVNRGISLIGVRTKYSSPNIYPVDSYLSQQISHDL
jgi:hypothetical protein